MSAAGFGSAGATPCDAGRRTSVAGIESARALAARPPVRTGDVASPPAGSPAFALPASAWAASSERLTMKKTVNTATARNRRRMMR